MVSICLLFAESPRLHGGHHQRVFAEVLQALKVLQGGKAEGGLKGSNVFLSEPIVGILSLIIIEVSRATSL